MLPKILITGVPGVGKTTIANHNLLIDQGFKYFQIGEHMREIGKERGIIKHSSDLNDLKIDDRKQLQKLVVEEMNSQNRGKGLIVDGHLVVDSSMGFIPGVELEMFKTCSFDAIVVIRSKVENIIIQRNKNIEKYKKNGSTFEHITIHQDLVYSSAMLYLMQCYVNLYFIDNTFGDIESAVASVNKIMESTILKSKIGNHSKIDTKQ